MTRFRIWSLLAAGVVLLLLVVPAVQAGEGEWTSKALKKLAPDGEQTEEEVKLVGKIISKDDVDKDGNKIARAFLEQDDGELIPLPCKKKDRDAGVAKKAAEKALGGEPSCWDFMGEKVELVGKAQSVMSKGKNYRRLGKIVGINPLG